MPFEPPSSAGPPAQPSQWPFSVVILTLNEEANLPKCFSSLSGCDDIVVVDSGSKDRTVAVAEARGARVFVRPFDNFANQRNFAQLEIPFRHSWVFHLDADEEFTPELALACAAAARDLASDLLTGYYVAPKMFFEGRWIPHCTDYPAWQARYVRPRRFTFIEVGHGQREAPELRLGKLTASYLHDLSRGGRQEWLAKHRRYAKAEARHQRENSAPLPFGALFAADALSRRRALKQWSARLPFRPAARFIYQYILRGGFLDGRAGFRYCQLLAQYEGFIVQELREAPPGTAIRP